MEIIVTVKIITLSTLVVSNVTNEPEIYHEQVKGNYKKN